MSKKNKILVIAAHPDDEIFGCAGTLIKHSKKKDDIYIIYLADGVTSRDNYKKKEIEIRKKQAKEVGKLLKVKKQFFLNFPDNKLDSLPLLDLIKSFEKSIKKLNPKIIYTHSFHDLNVDHRRAFELTLTCFRPHKNSSVQKIYSFEIPSSTNLHHYRSMVFTPNYFVNISNEIKTKKKLLRIYSQELGIKNHPRSLQNIINLSKLRGSESGLDFAEAFEVIRDIS